MSASTVRRVVKHAAVRAGIDPARATPHAMRRTFATLAALRDVPTKDIQRAMLHQHEATTERYVRAAKATARPVGDALADVLKRPLDSAL